MNTSVNKPIKYDLVTMQVMRKSGPMKGSTIEMAGWWNGCQWDGRKLKEGDKVVSWKPAPYMTV